MTTPMPGWRSLLFVPAHVDRFVAKAHTRGADAIILDLEDSVPADSKSHARQKARSGIGALAEHGVDAGVRINQDLRNAVADLDATVVSGTRFILVAKAMGAQHLQLIDHLIAELESERGLAVGGIRLIGLVETVAALAQIDDLAKACPRLGGIALGSEDLSADGGFEPTPQMLFNPSQALVFAARIAGIMAYGFPGSLTEYEDTEALEAMVRNGRSMGFDGALCIHPDQVAIMNRAFQPTASEVSHARRVVEAYETALAGGRGAVSLDGKMIDYPVVARAHALLKKA